MVNPSGIKAANLSFRIGDFAMNGLSLDIRRGEYFVLTGPNGAGKTILIKLISGLLSPEAGEISIHGQAVMALPPWKRNIGYVPQAGLLFPNRTVAQNIGFGLEVRRAGRKLLETEIARVAAALKIEYLLSRTIEGLSGGERQKVALGRALAINPAVLLLDEPVSSIDEEARDALCGELKRIQRELGITTLHVSHNRHETELVADRVGVLDAGTLKSVTGGD